MSAIHLTAISQSRKPREEEKKNDDTLMLLAIAGDVSAFAAIVDRHREAVRRLCCLLLMDEVLADDAAQDVFLKLWHKRDNYTPRGKFKPFLLTIARNHCRSLGRKRALGRWLGLEPGPKLHADSTVTDQPNPFQALQKTQDEILVQSGLKRLPEKFRIPLLLRYADNLSYEDIAQVIKRTPSAARSRVHYGLKKLATLVPPEVLA